MGEYSSFRLPSGIWCVHRRVKSSAAYVALTIGAGTRDEAPEQHGVAHLTEHLLFKGTARRSALQINRRLESVGGEVNAFTGKEETVLHCSCLRGDYLRAVDLLVDMTFGSTFRDSELEKERQIIIDEINSYKDSPSELIFDEFEELLFAGQPLGRDILGSKRNLQRVVREDVVRYTASNYNTDCMVFSSCSSMSHGRFAEVCERYWGAVEANLRGAQRVAPQKVERFDKVHNRRTYQSHTVLGGYAYDAYDGRRIELALLVNILGGSSSLSRLNMVLRERHALTYNVEASYTPYSDTGVWSIYFSCETHKREQALGLVMGEIARMRDVEISEVELRGLKKQFVGQLTLAGENSESLMLGVAKSLLVFGEWDDMDKIRRRIMQITGAELQAVAREVFEAGNIYSLTYL